MSETDDQLRQEIERLRKEMRDVAKRQRDACLGVMHEFLAEVECECSPEWPRCDLHRVALRVQLTPLVTNSTGYPA